MANNTEVQLDVDTIIWEFAFKICMLNKNTIKYSPVIFMYDFTTPIHAKIACFVDVSTNWPSSS